MIETNLPDDTISIPAFREEGDWPGWRSCQMMSPISIPAFREEGDRLRVCWYVSAIDFNPRLP